MIQRRAIPGSPALRFLANEFEERTRTRYVSMLIMAFAAFISVVAVWVPIFPVF